jgi:hypothetical protein
MPDAAMKVSLSTFARSGIESELGPDIAAVARAALSHYTSKLESGRPPLAPLRSLAHSDRGGDEDVLDLNLDPETEEKLEREAAKHETDLDALATHSVLVYLAELDFLGTSSRPV